VERETSDKDPPGLVLKGLSEPEYLKHWRERITFDAGRTGRKTKPGERPVDLAVWALGQERWDKLTEGLELPADLFESVPE
jgi:hypothetical protein